MIVSASTSARGHPGRNRMRNSQNRKTISAKVDQATYDAFNAACKSLGTNANALLIEFIEGVLDGDRNTNSARLSDDASRVASSDQIALYLNEILKHARIASLMAAGIAEQLDRRLWENALADVENEAARFVRRLEPKTPDSAGARPGDSRREAHS